MHLALETAGDLGGGAAGHQGLMHQRQLLQDMLGQLRFPGFQLLEQWPAPRRLISARASGICRAAMVGLGLRSSDTVSSDYLAGAGRGADV